ncbi:dynamin GTPase [Ranunculus cassubicifolius]
MVAGDSTSSSYTVGPMLSNLPNELLIKILLTLPIESLSICRAVSKIWYKIIKTPQFIQTFNINTIQNHHSPLVLTTDEFLLPKPQFHLINNEETSLIFYQNSLNPPQPISQIFFSNGWVLCVMKPREKYGKEIQPYLVYNPITGEQMVIPKSPVDSYPNRCGRQGVIGFGWDSVHNRFKVIRISDICGFKRYYGTFLEIFDFEKGEWRVIQWVGTYRDPCRASSIFRFRFRTNTFVNGKLHWISYPYREPMSIVCFDLDSEEFGIVPMPEALELDPIEDGIGNGNDGRVFEHYLLVLGECLTLVHNVSDKHVEVWIMKVYGSQLSWELRYIINNIVMDNASPVKGPYKPIKMMINGEILLLCAEENLGYYHPVTKVFRQVEVGHVLYRPSILKPKLHVGSLIYIAKKL